MRNVSEFLSENFPFLEVKFSLYLNRRVFEMRSEVLTAALAFSPYSPQEQNQYLCKYYRGLCSLFIHCLDSNISVSGQ